MIFYDPNAGLFINILRIAGELVVVLLPVGLYNVCDVIGWRTMLPANARGFSRVFAIHFSAETIIRSIPGGAPITDSIKVYLLKKEIGVAPSESIASVIWRRWFLGATQSVYFIVGILAAFPYIAASSVKLAGNAGLSWLALACSLALLFALLSLLLLPAVKIGGIFFAIMRRTPLRRVKRWAVEKKQHFIDLDKVLLTIKKRSARSILKTTAWHFCAWCTEAIETYVFLLLLGYRTPATQAIGVEILVSAVRLMTFFLPSGAGSQDLGYAGVLVAFGIVHSPLEAAPFVVMKRIKDFTSVGIGYALLLHKGIHPSRKPLPMEMPGL